MYSSPRFWFETTGLRESIRDGDRKGWCVWVGEESRIRVYDHDHQGPNEQMIVPPQTAGPPINPFIPRSFPSREYRERSLGLDYSNFPRINRITAHGTKPVIDGSSTACFPGLPSPTTALSLRLFRSFIKGSLAGGPDKSEAKRDHSCLPGSFPTTHHPTKPCDQHRLTTGRVVASQRTHCTSGVCPASEDVLSYHPAPFGHRVRQYRGSSSDSGSGDRTER